MTFFESFEYPGPDDNDDEVGFAYQPNPEMWGPPEGWMGASAAVEREIGRSRSAVIYLAGVTAYPMGFTFAIKTFLAGRQREPGTGGSSAATGGMGTPLGAAKPPRIGVGFPDGRKAAVIGAGEEQMDELGYAELTLAVPELPWDQPPNPATHITMEAQAGGGSESQYEQDLWVWPLPPEGRLAFVCDWEEFDVPESRAEVEGALILEASLRSSEAWE